MKPSRLFKAMVLSIASAAFGAGPAPGPAPAPAHRAPLAEHLARAEASVRALDHHLATAAERKAVKATDARLVERARKLARHHDKEPWAWAEYMKRVPSAVVVDDTSVQPDVAQQEAETAAAALGDDLDALWARRKQVEAERMVLWSKIAFRAVAERELSNQPLYRFELKVEAGKTPDPQRMEALEAAAQFVRIVDHLANQAQEAVDNDPSAVYTRWHTLLADARASLQDKLLSQGTLAMDVYKPATEAGQMAAEAKELLDLAQTVVDANRALAAADKAEDDEEADASRAQLQQALADTAGAVAALDGSVGRAATAWGIGFVPGTKAAVQDLPSLTVAEAAKTPLPSDSPKPAHVNTVAELRQQLAGTKWGRPDQKDSKWWFKLNADGTATAGWHKKPGRWVVTTGSTIVAVIEITNRTPEEYDVDLAEATVKGERSGVWKQIK